MSYKPQARFLVLIDGKPFQVFGVIEGKTGDFTISPARAKNFEEVEGDIGIRQIKLSAHVSANSKGTLLKHTIILDNGREKTIAAFINGPKEKLIFPAYSRLQGFIPLDRKLATIHPRDTSCLLATSVPVSCSLFYAIFITHKDQVLGESLPYVRHSMAGKHFGLTVYTCFVNIPAVDSTRTRILATSELRNSDDVAILKAPASSGAEPMKPEQLGGMLKAMTDDLCGDLQRSINEKIAPAGSFVDWSTYNLLYTTLPLEIAPNVVRLDL